MIASRTGEDGEQPIISINGEKPDIPTKSAEQAETQTDSTAAQQKDGKIHNASAEKQTADNRELKEAFEEEMSM